MKFLEVLSRIKDNVLAMQERRWREARRKDKYQSHGDNKK